ncbi:MAG: MHS family MFS transporter [Bacteroidia bacterium]|jgi:MFS family permease|nr:MHS family MFS transporter [Bacteroidia bacterium]
MSTQTTEESPTGIRKVLAASSVGTLIEWYDFYIFGSLAVLIGKHLFPTDAGASALINTLAIFAAGFIVRPFGALVFGRLGDLVGRKYTFLLTLILMGGSTFAIGIIPGYETIGYGAPILVLLMRLLQGLALGGEYGGAATYVSEHSPAHRRGFFTSWIQTTATLGLFLSLGVILVTKKTMGDEAFNDWGWRIPFIVSILLVLVSIYIRMKMSESPAFTKLKKEGKVSTNPLKESFSHRSNFKMVLLALFGAVMGQGVVWYTGQFYAQSFIENICKINFEQSRTILIWAILFATPFFIVFGSLSDKIGRKWIMMGGMFLAVISYRPIYSYFMSATDVKTKTEIADQRSVSRKAVFNIASNDSTITTTTLSAYTDGTSMKEVKKETISLNPAAEAVKPEVKTEKTLPGSTYWLFVVLVFVQIIYVTMVYGPIAAFLVELFPTKIRYSSMSLPYHIGNGVFGGLVPFLGTLIVSFTMTKENPAGDPLAGLWYPIGIATLCLIIGVVFLSNKRDENVMD